MTQSEAAPKSKSSHAGARASHAPLEDRNASGSAIFRAEKLGPSLRTSGTAAAFPCARSISHTKRSQGGRNLLSKYAFFLSAWQRNFRFSRGPTDKAGTPQKGWSLLPNSNLLRMGTCFVTTELKELGNASTMAQHIFVARTHFAGGC